MLMDLHFLNERLQDSNLRKTLPNTSI